MTTYIPLHRKARLSIPLRFVEATLHLSPQQLLTSRLLTIPLRVFIYEDSLHQVYAFHQTGCSLSLTSTLLAATLLKSVLLFRTTQASRVLELQTPQAFSLTHAYVLD